MVFLMIKNIIHVKQLVQGLTHGKHPEYFSFPYCSHYYLSTEKKVLLLRNSWSRIPHFTPAWSPNPHFQQNCRYIILSSSHEYFSWHSPWQISDLSITYWMNYEICGSGAVRWNKGGRLSDNSTCLILLRLKKINLMSNKCLKRL